jgi:hypothetical protein
MKSHYRYLALGFMVLALGACSIKRPYMIDQSPKLTPSEGKALVNFVRPSAAGYAAKATVWDGDKLIGVSFGKQYFQYECEPGRHLFLAWSEYKSPVEADLAPNKTYYIVLRVRPGWWRARIHQVPINKEHPAWGETMQSIVTLPHRTFDQPTLAAAEAESRPKILDYLKYYEETVKGTKHALVLRPEDGIAVDAPE